MILVRVGGHLYEEPLKLADLCASCQQWEALCWPRRPWFLTGYLSSSYLHFLVSRLPELITNSALTVGVFFAQKWGEME